MTMGGVWVCAAVNGAAGRRRQVDQIGALRATTFRSTDFVRLHPVLINAGGAVGRLAVLREGWRSVVTRNLNMFTLIAIGTGAAFLYSLVAVLFPSLFPDAFRHHGTVHVYFEAAAVIVTLVLLGQVLELRARRRTGAAIRELLSLAPPTARIVRDGRSGTCRWKTYQGDILRVRPGEKIPVDGKITDGRVPSMSR